MTSLEQLQSSLPDLELAGLLRKLPPSYSVPGPRVESAIQLSSNNYLGLATHPKVVAASIEAIQIAGCGATGSRLLSGNLDLHQKLEASLARFKGTPTALLFNSGYAANLSILDALTGAGDLVVCDKLNHASIIDGSKLAAENGAEVRYFRHRDWDRANELLSRAPTFGGKIDARKFLVLDAVFSMDGDIVDLPRAIELAREHHATLILDEAHSTGVLGSHGRGVLEHFGLRYEDVSRQCPVILMGTLGKALGGFGAFVASDLLTRELLINRARPFIFSTAMPPAVLGAALGAIDLLENEPERLKTLRDRANYLRKALRARGFKAPNDETPIIPIIIGEASDALRVSERLRELGVIALAARPPTVPKGTSRIRVTVMADHSIEDLEFAAEAIAKSCEGIRIADSSSQ